MSTSGGSISCNTKMLTIGGGNSNIFYFHPNLGFHDPIWGFMIAYFSDGLVNQPPTS